jgi:two-component system, chemotaxis family, CheB/CheR fusion protein
MKAAKVSKKKQSKSRKKTVAVAKKSKALIKTRIVGIGASAGGLDVFERMFSNMPNNTGIAFILITHLDSNHVSIMGQLISKYTDMNVHTIKNRMKIEANSIYVIPPNKNVSIKKNCLYLITQKKPHSIDQPINYFLESLAIDQKKNAIAVILSGNGNDGSEGLQSIKHAGGVTFAQQPMTAQYPSMPRNAIETGLVDFVLPVEKIPDALIKYINHESGNKSLTLLQQIFSMLLAQTGHDFSGYKLNTINRRIERQMHINGCASMDDYVDFLRDNPTRISKLFEDLLIGVTSFFRDPKAFIALKKYILTTLKNNKDKDYSFRVWIPGCSTGEEAYTIAIILQQCIEETHYKGNIQIFATDIDTNALDKARLGVYHKSIELEMTGELLKKYFIKEKNQYKAKADIRKMIVFGVQNIILDPPFTKLDIICCRNLLIYLNSNLQKKLLPIFHYSLKPKGLLFLGTSEATGSYVDLFRLIEKKWKIYERKDSRSFQQALVNYSTNLNLVEHPKFSQSLKTLTDEKSEIAYNLSKVLLKKYVVAATVINKKGTILFVQGKLNRFLKIPATLKNEMNIFEMLPAELKSIFTTSIRRASQKDEEIINNNLVFNKNKLIVNVKIIPLNHILPDQELLGIVFENTVQPAQIKEKLEKYPDLKKMAKRLVMLEDELEYTKETLQTTLEEHQSSNEELQSTNEELQSTNEEIETSKEELLSLNEELVIVNTELQVQIDQLVSMNDDMNNLLHSTEIMALFLDNDLKIKRYTPRVLEIISLLPSDIGRFYYHFANTIHYDKLTDDIKNVIKTQTSKTFEAKSIKNKWYQVKIMAYRTVANVIDGAVVIFSDITEHRDCLDKLRDGNEILKNNIDNFESIFEAVHIPVLILDNNFKITKLNKSFLNFFPTTNADYTGKHLQDVMKKLWNIPALTKHLNNVIKKNFILTDFAVNLKLSKGKTVDLLITANKFIQKNHEEMIFLTMRYKNE